MVQKNSPVDLIRIVVMRRHQSGQDQCDRALPLIHHPQEGTLESSESLVVKTIPWEMDCHLSSGEETQAYA